MDFKFKTSPEIKKERQTLVDSFRKARNDLLVHAMLYGDPFMYVEWKKAKRRKAIKKRGSR